MSTIRKYMFDNDFGATPGERGRSRSFGEAEVETLKARARSEGEEAGRHEAAQSIEAEAARTLAAIAREVAAQQATLATEIDSIRQSVLAVAVCICRKVLPALAERGAEEEVAQLVTSTLGELTQEPRVVVRVAPSLIEPLSARLQSAEAAFAGKLVLLGDEAIAPGDCAVLWADGGIERDTAKLLAAIDAAVTRHLSLTATEDDAPAPDLPSDQAAIDPTPATT